MSFKRFVFIFLVILVTIPMVGGILLYFSDVEDWVERYAAEKFGQQIELQTINIGWGLQPNILIYNLAVKNVEWAQSEAPMLEVETMEIRFSLKSLLKSRLEITDVEVVRPVLRLEQHPQSNRLNIVEAKLESASSTAARKIEFHNVSVVAGVIEFLFAGEKIKWQIDKFGLAAQDETSPVSVDLVSAINAMPLVVRGQVGSISQIYQHRETAINLVVSAGSSNNRATVSGVMGDLLEWRGLNLWVKSKLSDPETILRHWAPEFGQSLSVSEIIADWELVQPDVASTLKLVGLKAQAIAGGLTINVAGEIDQLPRLEGMDLTFDGAGPLDLPVLQRMPWLPEVIDVRIDGGVEGDLRDFNVNLDGYAETNQGSSGRIFGAMRWQDNQWLDGFDLTFLAENPEAVNIDLPKWSDVLFPLEMQAGLVYYEGQFDFIDIDLHSKQPQVELSGNGLVSDLGGELKGSIGFEGLIGEQALASSAFKSIGLFNQIGVSGKLNFTKSELFLNELNLSGEGDDIHLQAKGGLQRHAGGEQNGIKFELSLDHLRALQSMTELQLPGVTNVVATGNYTGSLEDGLKIADLEIISKNTDGAHYASGQVNFEGDQINGDLIYQTRLTTPAFLMDLVPDGTDKLVQEAIYPIHGETDISFGYGNETLTNLSLRNIVIESKTAQFEGRITGNIDEATVDNLKGSLGFKLDINNIQDFNILHSHFHWFPGLADAELSMVSVVMLEKDQITADINHLSVSSEDFSMLGEAEIGRFQPFQVDRFEIRLDTDDIVEVFAIPGLEFKNGIDAKLVLKGSHTALSGTNYYQIDSNLLAGGSDVAGRINYQSADKQSIAAKLDGSLHSKELNLKALLKEGQKSRRILSDSKLDFSGLDSLLTEIELDIDTFRLRNITVNQLNTRFSSKAGSNLLTLNSDTNNGKVNFSLGLEQHDAGYVSDFKLNLADMDMPRFISDEPVTKHGGRFDMRVDLSGTGSSIAEIAATANGELVLKAEDRKFNSRKLNLFGQDLFESVVSIVNPFDTDDRKNIIECGVVQFDVVDGIATSEQGIALKTTDFTLLGGGNVRLEDEAIRFVFTSKARKGLSINTNTFAKLVHVGGTLSKPKTKASAEGLLQTSAAVGAAIFSGGVSLLAQGLYDKVKANSDVCGIAQSKKATSQFRDLLESDEK